MHQGPKHLGAQTRATGTRTPNPEVEESTRSMRPKKTLKQACFQGYPESAVYVQIPVGSRNSASRNAYHTSLRPSSLFEPRHPSLKVVRKHSPIGAYRQRVRNTTRVMRFGRTDDKSSTLHPTRVMQVLPYRPRGVAERA